VRSSHVLASRQQFLELLGSSAFLAASMIAQKERATGVCGLRSRQRPWMRVWAACGQGDRIKVMCGQPCRRVPASSLFGRSKRHLDLSAAALCRAVKAASHVPPRVCHMITRDLGTAAHGGRSNGHKNSTDIVDTAYHGGRCLHLVENFMFLPCPYSYRGCFRSEVSQASFVTEMEIALLRAGFDCGVLFAKNHHLFFGDPHSLRFLGSIVCSFDGSASRTQPT